MRADAGRWTFQAGDFNTILGRGLLLSVIQNPAILQESTIDGGDATGRFGPLEVHALGGSVATETGDQSWRVAGLETSLAFMEGHRVAVRAVEIQDGRRPPFGPPVGLRQGRSVSLAGRDRSGALSYYGEWGHVAFRDRKRPSFPVAVDPREGTGAYGNLSWQRGAWFLMGETKRYENFDDALNTPPLADRETEKNDLHDASGRRIFLQRSFSAPDLTVFLSAGRYREGTRHGQNLYGGFKLQDGFGRRRRGSPIKAKISIILNSMNFQNPVPGIPNLRHRGSRRKPTVAATSAGRSTRFRQSDRSAPASRCRSRPR